MFANESRAIRGLGPPSPVAAVPPCHCQPIATAASTRSVLLQLGEGEEWPEDRERELVPGSRPGGGPRARSHFLNASAESTAFILNGETVLVPRPRLETPLVVVLVVVADSDKLARSILQLFKTFCWLLYTVLYETAAVPGVWAGVIRFLTPGIE